MAKILQKFNLYGVITSYDNDIRSCCDSFTIGIEIDRFHYYIEYHEDRCDKLLTAVRYCISKMGLFKESKPLSITVETALKSFEFEIQQN